MAAFPWQPNMTPALGPTWQQTTLHAQFLSDLSSSCGPSTDEVCCYVEETDAVYKFVQSSGATTDGWINVATNGLGVPGVWVLQGDSISIAPSGGSDDWPRLNRLMTAAAFKAKIVMRAGSWTCRTQGNVPGGTYLEAEPGVSIDATGVTVAGGVVFKAVDTTGTTGALTSNVTDGQPTFRDNTLYAVGDWVRIGGTGSTNPHIGNRYKILVVTPGVPNVYTVDRPIQYPFVIADPVRLITAEARSIVLLGHGATINAIADYVFQFQARESRIEGWHLSMNANSGSAGISIELSSFETWAKDCYADLNGNTTAIEFFTESAERCGFRDCAGVGGIYGLRVYDAVDGASYGLVCSGWTSGGAEITCHNTQTSPGSRNFKLVGGGFHGGANIGVIVKYATDTVVEGVSAYFNVQAFNAGASSGVAVRTKFIGCSSKGNTQYPFVTTTTAVETVFSECTSSGDGGGALLASSCDFIGCRILDGTVTTNFPVVVQNGPASLVTVRFVNCHISMAAAGGAQPLFQVQAHGTGTLRVDIEKTLFEMKAAGQTAVQDSGGTNSVVTIRDVIGTQTAACSGYVGAAACTLRKYGRVDFGGLTTPFTINAAGFVNSPTGNTAAPAAGVVGEGTFGLNNAAAVAYPFPDVKAGDAVKLTRRTVAGTPLPGWSFVITPGTGVAITGTATDTSVVDIEIGG